MTIMKRLIFVFLFVFLVSSVNAQDIIILREGGGSGASVEDDVYGSGWNGDTTHAPSQNAVYDKFEIMEPALTDEASLYSTLSDVTQFLETGDNATLLDGNNWKIFHTNGSGDVTEIALGANGTFLESNGASAAPAFRTLVFGDLPTLDAFELTLLTSAPGSPAAGRWYYADNSTWDPCDIAGTDNYYCIYDGTNYIAIMDEDGVIFVSSIECPTLKASELNDTSDPHLLTTAELKNKIITNSESTGADEWDFPARTEGWNFEFIIEAAQNVTLDPNGSEQWYLNGTQLAAGEAIVNAAPTVAESIVCISTESGVYCESKYSDWAEETP